VNRKSTFVEKINGFVESKISLSYDFYIADVIKTAVFRLDIDAAT
jgi:hypothetical protein